MAIAYSDQEIKEFMQERKILPNDWRNQLYKNEELFVKGKNGNTFGLRIRQHNIYPLNFSAILTVREPLSNREFRLRRYNGSNHTHTNRIEREEISGCHIHSATERYQLRGQREDGYAQSTNRYHDLSGALKCLINDANFEEPPQHQQELF